MTTLLKELNNQEIDWLISTGHHQEITTGTLLPQNDQASQLYILLEGELLVSCKNESRTSSRLFQIGIGEMFGSMPWLDPGQISLMAKASTPCSVLEIPLPQLLEKLEHDPIFAAHFHRASAIQINHQLDVLIQQLADRLGLSVAILKQPQLRGALTVFAELQDQDLDWMIAVGQVQSIAANTVLVRQDRPFDALSILLDGVLGLRAVTHNPMEKRVRAFFEYSELPESEIARLSRGEVVGEMALLNGDLSPYTIQAVRDSQIFSLPRWRLAAKLLHDMQFAARFYRVLATLLRNKQQSIIQNYCISDALDHTSGSKKDGFVDSHRFLSRIELAEARFEWMLQRIQTQFGMEKVLQW